MRTYRSGWRAEPNAETTSVAPLHKVGELRDTSPGSAAPVPVVAGIVRGAIFIAFWLALARWSVADAIAGLGAAALAAWVSLLLMPPSPQHHASAAAIARIAMMFPIQSLVAGFDVAWRVFDPRLPLRPGIISCPMKLKGQTECSVFRALMSLQPGSLPVHEGPNGALLVHCLDRDQPIAARYVDEEALFAKAIGAEIRHG